MYCFRVVLLVHSFVSHLLLFMRSLYPILVETITHFAGKDTLVFVSYEPRIDREHQFFETMAPNFDVKEVRNVAPPCAQSMPPSFLLDNSSKFIRKLKVIRRVFLVYRKKPDLALLQLFLITNDQHKQTKMMIRLFFSLQ